MKSEAYKAAEATRQTTESVVEEAHPQITAALKLVNAEVQELIQMAENSQGTEIPLLPARPSRWRRFTNALDRRGHRLGRRRHRTLILAVMALLGVGTLLALVFLLYLVLVPEAVRQSTLTRLVTQGEIQSVNERFWFYLRVFLRGLVGLVPPHRPATAAVDVPSIL